VISRRRLLTGAATALAPMRAVASGSWGGRYLSLADDVRGRRPPGRRPPPQRASVAYAPGDYTFHVHMVIPANSGSVLMSVLAADLVAPPTDQTTGETRVVWNLQVTPVPWSATLLLVLVGGIGLLLSSFQHSSANCARPGGKVANLRAARGALWKQEQSR